MRLIPVVLATFLLKKLSKLYLGSKSSGEIKFVEDVMNAVDYAKRTLNKLLQIICSTKKNNNGKRNGERNGEVPGIR